MNISNLTSVTPELLAMSKGKEEGRVWADFLESYARAAGGAFLKEDGSPNHSALAEKIGVAQPTVTRLLKGTHEPRPPTQKKIAATIGVPHGTVIGSIFRTQPDEVSPFARELAGKIEKLPIRARALMAEHVDLLIELAARAKSD